MQDPGDPSGYNSPRIRAVRRIGSIIVIATGLVWIGQGTGLVPGSFMTGDPFWGFMGIAALVVGVIVAWLSFRGDVGSR